MAGLTGDRKAAWDEAGRGIVVDMKRLTGENVNRKRMDIDILLTKYPDTFNLFLQAMSKMQDDPSSVGYYQVAGIHGWPRALWTRVPQRGWVATSLGTWENNEKTFRDGGGGYCAHGVHIFGPWHRPYLGLLEQSLYRHMYDIAQSYTDQATKTRYLEALKYFRLPYYDYFRPRGGEVEFPGVEGSNRMIKSEYDFRLPDIFMIEKVTVRVAPDDKAESIDNPLYTYSFKNKKSGRLDGQDALGLAQSFSPDMTIRATRNRAATAHNAQQLSWNLNMGREDRCALFLAMMKDEIYRNFATVASDTQLSPGDFTSPTRVMASGSLEGLHNSYHVEIGDGGHMTDPRFASFDPIFWFHHCNVDRYFALWQASNPNEWLPKPTRRGQNDEGLKPLLPFYKARPATGQPTYWTSNDCRDTASLGYVYDDFDKIRPGKDGVRNYVNEKYRWAARVPNDRTIRPPPEDMKPLEKEVRASLFFNPPSAAVAKPPTTSRGLSTLVAQAAPSDLKSSGPSAVVAAAAAQVPIVMSALSSSVSDAAPSPPDKVEPIFDREWYVDSTVKRAAANGPFTIYFFLALKGEIVGDPQEFAASPFLAGLHQIFASPREGCDNCAEAEAAGKLSVSTTPITSLLLQYLDLPDNGLESLQPEHVKPFLVKYLRWRVVYQNFEGQDPRTVPDLNIGVSAKIYHEGGGPTYEEYPEVVQEIIGGASTAADA